MRTLYIYFNFFVSLSVKAQKTIITQLEVDKLINPLGLDSRNPDFSWRIKSDEYDLNQTHYQILLQQIKYFQNKAWFGIPVKSTHQSLFM